jgi:hypothetical protein
MSNVPKSRFNQPVSGRVARYVASRKKGRGDSEKSLRRADLFHEYLDPLLWLLFLALLAAEWILRRLKGLA